MNQIQSYKISLNLFLRYFTPKLIIILIIFLLIIVLTLLTNYFIYCLEQAPDDVKIFQKRIFEGSKSKALPEKILYLFKY